MHIHNQLMAREEGRTPHTHQSAIYTSQFTSMNEMEQTCPTFFPYNIQKNIFEDRQNHQNKLLSSGQKVLLTAQKEKRQMHHWKTHFQGTG